MPEEPRSSWAMDLDEPHPEWRPASLDDVCNVLNNLHSPLDNIHSQVSEIEEQLRKLDQTNSELGFIFVIVLSYGPS
jgi:hypothetical protein